MAITYRDAGVDMDRGDELVERIKPFSKATRIAEVMSDVGGFAGMCRVPEGIEEPVLVSGTDGVGTKLKLAFLLSKHDTIGFDLVGMCVNDVLTCGARPLFFLDYFATGELDVCVAESVIRGIADACKEAGCALLGGETAELPGMYHPGEYDLAGFSVGVVARKKIVDGKSVKPGDVVLGLPSSGLHSNGYSLARKVLLPTASSASECPAELAGQTLGAAMMAPTRVYAKAVSAAMGAAPILAMSHITGGGLPGNLPRVLPEGMGVQLKTWRRPPLFDLIKTRGPVDEAEMRRTFNLGIGYVLVVARADADAVRSALVDAGEAPIDIGEVIAMSADVAFEERVVFA